MSSSNRQPLDRVTQRLKNVSLVKRSKKRGAGRPRKIQLLPKDEETATIQKQKDDHLTRDKLSRMLKSKPNSLDILDHLMLEFALEAASLQFERLEAERKGGDTASLSARKVTALKSVADIFFKKRETIIDQAFDFKSQRFQKFIEWILLKVVRRASEKAGLQPEQISILFDKIAHKFEEDTWEKEALEYIKAAE
jgi:hypothetical protein